MSAARLHVRVCALSNLSPRLRSARLTCCLPAGEDEESRASSFQTSPAVRVKSNSPSLSAAELTQSQEELLAEFEEYIDEIEIDTEKKLNASKRRAQGKKHNPTELEDAYLKRLDILAALPDELVIESVRNKCPGCGSVLQCETADRPGYLPQTVVEGNPSKSVVRREDNETDDQLSVPIPTKPSEPVCQRCYRLTHYGTIESHLRVRTKKTAIFADPSTTQGELIKPLPSGTLNELSPGKFRKSLERLRNLNAVIVYLVDIFDFHGTFIPSIRDIIGHRNPIVLAVNKVDLLPKNYKPSRVVTWIEQECSSMGLHDVAAIRLVSSTKGIGVNALLADAVRIAKLRRSDVYVIGAANVGKSSFINQLLRIRKKGQVHGGDDKRKERRRGLKRSPNGAITTSVVPGTTLDMIRIPLGGNVSLFDTPGLMMPHQLTNYLNEKELRAVVPSKTVEHVTFRLGEGKALYVGGLARLEVISGKPFFFTCFFSPMVKIHPGRVQDAEEFALRHVGEILTPPYSEDRFLHLGEWTSKSFTAEGESWKKSSVDIVLSGLGWISVTGPGSVRLRVWVPKGVGVFTREPLMPFEAESGVSRYTGTAPVNKKQMRKAARRRRSAREE